MKASSSLNSHMMYTPCGGHLVIVGQHAIETVDMERQVVSSVV